VSVVKTTTDGDGHYIFIGGVDAGTYVFVIAAAGYDELTATLSHSGNLTRDFAVTPTGVVSVFFGLGTVTPGCVSNRPGPTNVRVSNRTIYTMRVTVYGCQLIERCEPDPVSRTVTLVPDGTQTFDLVGGQYNTTGASVDGRAAIVNGRAIIYQGCDYVGEVRADR
jgi:hypothetical protein